MKCSLCKREDITVGLVEGKILDYSLCSFCHWLISKMISSTIQGKNLKIQWGNRSISIGDWIELKKFLIDNEVETILEFGIGLSTELLSLEGYKIWCLESEKSYLNIYASRLYGNRIHGNVFCFDYDLDEMPVLPNIILQSWHRGFDFALVDSPQGKGHRWREAMCATQHTKKFIYLHDPTAGQLEVLKGWKPIQTLSHYNGLARFYKKGD